MGMTSCIYGWASVRLDERDLVEIMRRHGYEVRRAGDPCDAVRQRQSFNASLAELARQVDRGISEEKARVAYESLCRRFWQPSDGFRCWWVKQTMRSAGGFNPNGVEGL